MYRVAKRFFRFSLLTWFIIFSVLCLLAFGYARIVHPSRKEANAIRGLEELGLEVQIYYQHYDAADGLYMKETERGLVVTSASVSPGPDWLKSIFGEMVFARISSVSLKGKIETLDDCCDFLTDLSHLTALEVESETLTSVDALKNFPRLEEVKFSDCSDLRDVDALSGLNLSSAMFAYCGVESIDSLAKGESLSELIVHGCDRITQLNLNDWAATNLSVIEIEMCQQLISVTGFPKTDRASSSTLKILYCEALEKVAIEGDSIPKKFTVVNCKQLAIVGASNPLAANSSSFRSVNRRESKPAIVQDHIEIYDCANLVSLELPAKNTAWLGLGSCDDLTSLDLHPFSMLKSVTVEFCENITSISGLSSSIEELLLEECPSLERVLPAKGFPNLKTVEADNCPKLIKVPEVR